MGPITIQWEQFTTSNTSLVRSFPTAFSGTPYTIFMQCFGTLGTVGPDVWVVGGSMTNSQFNWNADSGTKTIMYWVVGPT